MMRQTFIRLADALMKIPVRRLILRDLAFLLSTSLICLSPLACRQSQNDLVYPNQPEPVAWITDRPDSVRWEAILRAAQEHVKQYPFLTYNPLEPSAQDLDVSDQILQAVDQGAAYIVLWHDSTPAPLEAITLAESRGVTIITIDREIPRNRPSNHVALRLDAAAEDLGRSLSNYAAPRKAFILLHHRERDDASRERYERFAAGLAAQAELVQVAGIDATGKDPVNLINASLDQFPNTKLVVTLECDLWLRPAAVTVRPGVHYVSLDAPPALWRDVKSGRALALIGLIDGDIAQAALSLISELATTARRPVPQRSVDYTVVTPDNLNQFAAEYAQSVGLPVTALWE
jgi:ABC-type sugar transport system substrate-binding protein